MKNLFKFKVLTTALLLASVNVAYADVNNLIQNCDSCHGRDGMSQTADIPTIAGIPEVNLSDQLREYLDGRPAKTVNHVLGDKTKKSSMTEVVKTLSEDQMDELAAHYGALPFVAAKQSFDVAKAEHGEALHKANCEKCHSEGGSLADDESSILAGQHKEYLRAMLGEIKGGQRDLDKSMVKALNKLSDADLDALAEYYASQQ